MAVLKSSLILNLIDNVSGRAKGITGALNGLQRQSSSFLGMGARLAAFGATYLGVTAGFENTYTAAADAQSGLTEIGVKANLSTSALAQMQARLAQLAPVTNQFAADLTSGVDVMLGMGLSADQAMGSIGAVGKAATATGATMTDLSAASVSAMQNFKIAPSEISRMLEGLASAGNNGAFELKEMASYLPGLGAAYQGLGQTGVKASNDLAAALQIVRQGTGDSASAAGNLGNVLQKINAPQTRAAFKKLGLNLGKEMKKATDRGMSPIEAIAEVTNKALKGDLGKLGDLFSDSEVQKGLRPLIQNMAEFRRIRDEANSATGTIADAYGRRMDDANQKVKSLQVSLSTLGTSIGNNFLGPVSESADYLAEVINTLEQRSTIFDRVGAAGEGLFSGMGLGDAKIGIGLANVNAFLFGTADASKAADEIGGIFKRFHDMGSSVRWLSDAIKDSPVADFLERVGSYAGTALLAAGGIGLLAASVTALARGIAMFSGLSAAIAIFKSVSGGGNVAAVPEKTNGKSGKNGPSKAGGTGFSLGNLFGLFNAYQLVDAIPDTKEGIEAFAAANKKSADGVNTWLDGLITTPSEYLKNLTRNTSHPYAGIGTDGSVSARPNQAGSVTGGTPAADGSVSARPVAIDASSIAAMVAPSGVQQVQVQNPQPVELNLTVNQTISGITSPQAAADSAASKMGAATKAAVEASFGGM